ncbi:MAG: hypothetical protein KGP29_05485 [Proteobacteria bacterium]|nr:hypothetical protein [Pseudomonadota bacterium]
MTLIQYFRQLTILTLLIFVSSCATPLTKNQIVAKNQKLGIIGFKITAPITKLSSIQDSFPEKIDAKTEELLLADSFKKINNKASEELISHLKKSKLITPILIDVDKFGIKHGEKPSKDQLQQIKNELGIDAVFYGEIVGYGKSRLLYPTLLAAGDIALETVVLGVVTSWNPAVLTANAGLELATNVPIYFGGFYLFGTSFRPVAIDAHVVSTSDGKEIWDDSVDSFGSKKDLKLYVQEIRSKKEIQLEASLKSAIRKLSFSIDKEIKNKEEIEDKEAEKARITLSQ